MCRNPYLTDKVLKATAGRAYFVFQLQLFDEYGADGYNGNERVMIGDGVTVMDEVTAILDAGPAEIATKFIIPAGGFIARLDVGEIFSSDFRNVNQLDIAALRAIYVGIYGDVPKPVVYDGTPQGLF